MTGRNINIIPETFVGTFQMISARDPFCDPLALLTLSSIAFTVPAVFSILLKLRYKPDSNPTLSAMLLKTNKLLRIINHSQDLLSSAE